MEQHYLAGWEDCLSSIFGIGTGRSSMFGLAFILLSWYGFRDCPSSWNNYFITLGPLLTSQFTLISSPHQNFGRGSTL